MRTCARLGVLLAVAAVLLLNSAETGASPGTTTRVSVSSAGVQGNNESHDANISPDGRYVAFDSRASTLVTDDTALCGTVSCSDVFVRDRQTGVTERVSLSSGGEQGTGDSQSPAINESGRYVVFQSFAPNLVPDDTPACPLPVPPYHRNCADIFVRDRQTSTTTRINLSSGGAEANGDSWAPAISASGRYVAFTSDASTLVTGDTNGYGDVFVRDRDTDADGIFDEAGAVSTIRVSLSTGGAEANGDSWAPAISASGRYVAFVSDASNLVSQDNNNAADVFVRDRDTDADGVFDEPGAVSTARVSLSSGGAEANSSSYEVSISGDGRYVAFSSDASTLVTGDTNACRDIFVRDRQAPGTTTRMSVNSSGGQANAASYSPAISGDGTYVAFESPATNLVPGDTNGVADVFVRTRATGGMALVSVDSWEGQGNGESSLPAINGDGRYVAFESVATNLVINDSNGVADVFVHNFWPAGGIAELPDVALAPASQAGASGQTYAALAGAAAAAVALAVGAWCVRRRFRRL